MWFLVYIVAGLVASVSDMAGCRTRLAGNFEGCSILEHNCNCAEMHGIIASLLPMKDSSSWSVRYFGGQLKDGKTSCRVVGFAFVLSVAYQCGSERYLSSQMAK